MEKKEDRLRSTCASLQDSANLLADRFRDHSSGQRHMSNTFELSKTVNGHGPSLELLVLGKTVKPTPAANVEDNIFFR